MAELGTLLVLYKLFVLKNYTTVADMDVLCVLTRKNLW